MSFSKEENFNEEDLENLLMEDSGKLVLGREG